MTPTRFVIFFTVFLFGAYSMHQAKIDVKEFKTKTTKQMDSKELIGFKALPAFKLNGAIMYVNTQPCALCIPLMYPTQVDKICYCIPGSIDSISLQLPVKSFHHKVGKSPWR